MHRIDGAGATIDNKFTEGNPALSIPATVVTDDWANDVQEELVTVIEDQGITLVKGQQDQLKTAIEQMIQQGGPAQLSVSIANNQAVAQSVTGLIFNKASVKAAHIQWNLERRTDSQNVQESGWLYVYHDAVDDLWRITTQSFGDDAGVSFSISATGQVQYTSSNFAGTSYQATLRVGMRMILDQ